MSLDRTLLLCPSAEVEKAYDCCLQNVFDDYLVDRPLQDGRRLQWAIRQAMSATHGRRKGESTEVARVAMGMVEEALAHVTHALEKGEDIRQESKNIHGLLEKELKESVMGLARRLGTPEYAPYASVTDEQGLQESLGRYADQNVVGAVERAQVELDRQVTTWQRNMDEGRRRLTASTEGVGRIMASFVKANILVVEDDADYRSTLVDILGEHGYGVMETSDGMRAVALLNRYSFDLILMDYQLPGMNGLETIELAALGSESGLPPVIILTGYGTKELVRRSIGVGAAGFMVKPVRQELLLSKVAEHIGRSRAGALVGRP